MANQAVIRNRIERSFLIVRRVRKPELKRTDHEIDICQFVHDGGCCDHCDRGTVAVVDA